jgi:hypothetical protein
VICRECENFQKVTDPGLVGFVCKACNVLVWPTMIKCLLLKEDMDFRREIWSKEDQ